MDVEPAAIRGIEPARLRRLARRGVACLRRGRRARARRSAWSSRVRSRSRIAPASNRASAAACSSSWRSSMRRPTPASTRPRAPSTGAGTSTRRARSPATSRANIPRSRIRVSAHCGSRTRSAISLRDTTGSRPDIATDRPGVRVHAHANGPNVTVSIDLSGEGLHRRGYRAQAGEAPLRENLAAGILRARRLAGEIEGCRRVPRSDVRLGHAGHRGRDDRRECRARRAAAAISVSSDGWDTTASPGNA